MNNPLADLEERTRAAFPAVSVEHHPTRAPERFGIIDIRQGDRLIAVMWTPDDGICITEVDDDGVFDDTPDFVVRPVDEALQVLTFLLGAADLNDVDGIDGPARKAA